MKAWILAALALSVVGSALADSYTYQTINLPGVPVGIDRAGDIAGNYTDSTGTHGYVDVAGLVTTLATGYSVLNLNQNGTLLLADAAGFATYTNGTYTQLAIPSFTPPGIPATPLSLTPSAINDSGQLVASLAYGFYSYPFLVTGNQLTPLPTVAIYDTSSFNVTGLTDAGIALGTYTTAVHCCGFEATGALYDPAAAAWNFVSDNNAGETSLNALNNSGQAVGADIYSQGPPDFAVDYTGGIFTPIAPPGATFSTAVGINDSGTILGYYGYNSFTYFLATPTVSASPVPEPSLALLMLIGLAALPIYNRLRKRFGAEGVHPEFRLSSFASRRRGY